jgi:hypothetical protein
LPAIAFHAVPLTIQVFRIAYRTESAAMALRTTALNESTEEWLG